MLTALKNISDVSFGRKWENAILVITTIWTKNGILIRMEGCKEQRWSLKAPSNWALLQTDTARRGTELQENWIQNSPKWDFNCQEFVDPHSRVFSLMAFSDSPFSLRYHVAPLTPSIFHGFYWFKVSASLHIWLVKLLKLLSLTIWF